MATDTLRLDASSEEQPSIFRRPTLFEAFAILFGIAFMIGLNYLNANVSPNIFAPDFGIYLRSVQGDYTGFYYAYWSLPLYMPFVALNDIHLSLVIWTTLNVLGIFFAARVLGGKAAIALLSYQMLAVIYHGQIVGIIIGGWALYIYLLQRNKPLLAGVGAVLALTKPQLGVPLILAAALVADVSWKDRIVSSLLPWAALLLSLLAYGNWPLEVWERVQAEPPIALGSITLWDYIGAWSLLLWLPAILLPMKPKQRLIAIAAASSLAVPYYQQTGLLALYALPTGYLGLLGNLGYLNLFVGWDGLEALMIVPILAYGWVVGRSGWRLVSSRMPPRAETASSV